MKIVTRTYTSNEHWNGECDYALIDLTPELAKKIAMRRKLLLDIKERDPEISRIQFYDTSASFYERHYNESRPYPPEFDEALELSDSDDYAEIPETVDMSFLEKDRNDKGELIHDVKATADTLIIFEDTFGWISYMEGLDVESQFLSYNILSRVI